MIKALEIESKRALWKDRYFILIGVFYFFQGLHLAGIGVYGNIRMAAWGVPVATQALLRAFIVLPTFVKMFSGLLSDRRPMGRIGRRRPYFALSLVIYLPSFILLLSLNSFSFVFLLALFGVMLGWMFCDSTMDGLSVDITPPEHQGRFQGVHSAARMVGFGIGSVFIPMVGPAIGWPATILILFAAALAQVAMAFLYREPSVTRAELRELTPLKAVMGEAFGSSRPWLGIALMLALSAVSAVPGVAQIHILTDLGWSKDPAKLKLYGWLNLAFYAGAAIGSAAFGELYRRRGSRLRFHVLTAALYWVFCLPWLLLGGGDSPTLIFASMFSSGIGYGLVNVLTFSIAMKLCPASIEGFMFFTFMSFANIGEYALGANIITSLSGLVGGLIPAFYTLVPFSLLWIWAVRGILAHERRDAAVAGIAS
jgi:MFS family permease